MDNTFFFFFLIQYLLRVKYSVVPLRLNTTMTSSIPGHLYAPCLVENWPSVRNMATFAVSIAVANACALCPATSVIDSKLCAIQHLTSEASTVWRNFMAAVEANINVRAVIGTRDRAAALYATLSLWQPPRAEGLRITVMFSASSALHRDAYIAIGREFPLVTFLERRFENDYYSMLTAVVSTTSASHILLLADDTLLRLPTNFAQLGGFMNLLAVPSAHFAGCGSYMNCFDEAFYPHTSISHLGIAQYNDAFKDTHVSAEGWHAFMQQTASTFGSGDDHLYEMRLLGTEFSGLQQTLLISNTTGCNPYQDQLVLMCYTRPIDGSLTSTSDFIRELNTMKETPTNPGDLEKYLTNHHGFPGLGYFEEYTIFSPSQLLFNIQDLHAYMSVRSDNSPPLLSVFAEAINNGCRQHPLLANTFMQWLATEEQGCKYLHLSLIGPY